jgi:hypothetical protein
MNLTGYFKNRVNGVIPVKTGIQIKKISSLDSCWS